MNYSIKIVRGTKDFHEIPSLPISKDEWHETIRNHSELDFDIGLERSNYDYATLKDPDGTWLHIEDDGSLVAENPTPVFIYLMLSLADGLAATVVGEESETYELTDEGFQSRQWYADGDRVFKWHKVKTEDGFEFSTDKTD